MSIYEMQNSCERNKRSTSILFLFLFLILQWFEEICIISMNWLWWLEAVIYKKIYCQHQTARNNEKLLDIPSCLCCWSYRVLMFQSKFSVCFVWKIKYKYDIYKQRNMISKHLTLSPTRGGFRSHPLAKFLIALNFA